ncbi:Anti-anti-sigma regulatory factor (antagonist of anti-sigma factor) [Asanoa hainanensis]|uniref:Anti-anti-sigma regulatory factor (Antagonist of anti-sigma factor) n=1 Tax=Asanoa hainanensis TaxID=560556 RepID=A0A239FP00_9ACTN|nr:MEDS domain-containing protein [Asanoa hainanensis]SNS58581.1 Anti-anti-sigma regulatory factor (antagonist of anti-sigma factor) [Asanoa hainanensis]
MRAAGAPVARPFGAGRHVCWAYADRAEFVAVARRFFAEGRAAGGALRLVGGGLPDIDGIRCSSFPDPAAELSTWAAATEAALADGYTGLWVVGDATPLASPAFAAYEHQIDRFIARHPLFGLCAYDRRVVDPAALADLACLHPTHNVPGVPFRLHAEEGTGHLAISGELDSTGTAALARALDRAAPAVVDGELVVEAGSLDFVDHRSLLQLASYARDRGATAVLRTPLPAAARLVELLRVPGIRVEAS